MLKTGEEHLESLRDGRKVYIGNELVDDVTTHPAFKNGARSFAMLYDKKRAPENIDVMSFEEDGERYSSWFLQAKTQDDLRKRMETHRRVASSDRVRGRSIRRVAGSGILPVPALATRSVFLSAVMAAVCSGVQVNSGIEANARHSVSG